MARIELIATLLAIVFTVAKSSRGDEQKSVLARVAEASKRGASTIAPISARKEMKVAPASKASSAASIIEELSESRDTVFVGQVPATRVVSGWYEYRTVFIMAMVLVAFARHVWSAAVELKRMTNMMGKLSVEAESIAAASGSGNNEPMSPREFAAANGLAPTASTSVSAQPVLVSSPSSVVAARACQMSRRSRSQPTRTSDATRATRSRELQIRQAVDGTVRRAHSSER
eukprot:TRINITY_DN75590_c0_g1_i1.p1 TRINITY_DN75590_c0_g1~~TRINITY_DN75590_c0_g1_i1.p1  ORF type:complete len:230 (-),score=38.68 TRINITY_DN75590_c0_g1_i1:98-787(-)